MVLPSMLKHYISGCIAAGFTHCCAYGASRVELPDGGQCYCDQECFKYRYYNLQRNCCSDNPCQGNVGPETDVNLIALAKGLQSWWFRDGGTSPAAPVFYFQLQYYLAVKVVLTEVLKLGKLQFFESKVNCLVPRPMCHLKRGSRYGTTYTHVDLAGIMHFRSCWP